MALPFYLKPHVSTFHSPFNCVFYSVFQTRLYSGCHCCCPCKEMAKHYQSVFKQHYAGCESILWIKLACSASQVCGQGSRSWNWWQKCREKLSALRANKHMMWLIWWSSTSESYQRHYLQTNCLKPSLRSSNVRNVQQHKCYSDIQYLSWVKVIKKWKSLWWWKYCWKLVKVIFCKSTRHIIGKIVCRPECCVFTPIQICHLCICITPIHCDYTMAP